MIDRSKPTVSFCIITNGKRPKKLKKLLNSIASLQIATYQIVICGYLDTPPKDVKYIEDRESADNGKLGKMRNKACSAAKHEVLIVTDDDVLFAKNFYKALCCSDLKFDVACSIFLNPDGSRFWDWAIENSNEHRLLPYDANHPDIYITGGRCIIKKRVFERINWNETLGFYEREDIEFSQRVKSAGYKIKLLKKLSITHNDWTYTQIKEKVKKYSVTKVLLINTMRNLGIFNDNF
jgi:hypothetical protein